MAEGELVFSNLKGRGLRWMFYCKQNNFNINKLKKHAITWQELIKGLREFLGP